MARQPLSLEKRELRHTMNGFSEKDNAHDVMHNVRDDLSLLASGVFPAREAEIVGAESPERTGIKTTGSFGLFFCEGVESLEVVIIKR